MPQIEGFAKNLLSKGIFAVNKEKLWTSVEVLENLKEILIKVRVENYFGKTTPSTPDRDLNLDLTVIGGLVYCKSNTLDHSATEADLHPSHRPRPLKLGHGGTLDHTATGVLGVCWGCKVLPKLLSGDKKYFVRGRFGTATDTYNEAGTTTKEAAFDHITEEMVMTTLKTFVGHVLQTPPKYSALKRNGIRLADLTRCAHVTQLHRLQHGPFTESEMLEKEDWTAPCILDAIVRARNKHGHLFKKRTLNKETELRVQGLIPGMAEKCIIGEMWVDPLTLISRGLDVVLVLAADQFSFDVDLRVCRPIGEGLQSLANLFIGQNVEGLELYAIKTS
uniref:tRNA pseudouridine(55) synthase n=1 Tax=Timema cristinae TaxID=61476 RepID=A0A7R9D901_TIMCR|nr:unnamed protein product [Timema cristinae]